MLRIIYPQLWVEKTSSIIDIKNVFVTITKTINDSLFQISDSRFRFYFGRVVEKKHASGSSFLVLKTIVC